MLKNPFALHKSTNAIVHIDDAESTQGPFICSGCRSEMRLLPNSVPHTRKGSDKVIIKRGHFAHVQQDECDTGLETSLHLWGKMIIEEAMTVGLPPHHVVYREIERDFDTDWAYSAVTLEEWQDGIRPDVVLHHDTGRLNVEIKVSHAVDLAKLKVLRERSQSCIEIDLKGLDFNRTPGSELRDAILTKAPRVWIVHQLENERLGILKEERQVGIDRAGKELRRLVDDVPHLITNQKREEHEGQIAELGTAPFIGRAVPGSHWFCAPARNWQHTVLRDYLITRPDSDGDIPYDRPPSFYRYSFPKRMVEESTIPELKPFFNPYSQEEVFQNLSLPDHLKIDVDILTAAGLNIDTYGSPRQTVAAYFRTLCDEADIDGAHPIARRIVCHGSKPNTMRIHPERAEYINRRNEVRNAYMQAGRRRRLNDDNFRTWYATPLSKHGTTPKKICINGGVDHAKLIAHIHAILNMINGGWPVQHLLGIEETWLRDRQARTYNRSDADGGGPHPYYKDTHRRCASYVMMRSGTVIPRILSAMATRLHGSEEKANTFLHTPNRWIADTRPVDFATDIPTLQRCIGLMPGDPALHRPGGTSYQRIW
jgi:uncharacterized protein (DUF2384 family)